MGTLIHSIIFFSILVCTIHCRNTATSQNLPSIEALQKSFQDAGYFHIALISLNPDSARMLLNVLGEPESSLAAIDNILQNGYSKLIEELSERKPTTRDTQNLSGYTGSDWESRTIGFTNWIKRLRGHLLLNRADALQYQIFILQQSESDTSLIQNKQLLLKKTLDSLSTFLSESSWMD